MFSLFFHFIPRSWAARAESHSLGAFPAVPIVLAVFFWRSRVHLTRLAAVFGGLVGVYGVEFIRRRRVQENVEKLVVVE